MRHNTAVSAHERRKDTRLSRSKPRLGGHTSLSRRDSQLRTSQEHLNIPEDRCKRPRDYTIPASERVGDGRQKEIFRERPYRKETNRKRRRTTTSDVSDSLGSAAECKSYSRSSYQVDRKKALERTSASNHIPYDMNGNFRPNSSRFIRQKEPSIPSKSLSRKHRYRLGVENSGSCFGRRPPSQDRTSFLRSQSPERRMSPMKRVSGDFYTAETRSRTSVLKKPSDLENVRHRGPRLRSPGTNSDESCWSSDAPESPRNPRKLSRPVAIKGYDRNSLGSPNRSGQFHYRASNKTKRKHSSSGSSS